MAHEVLNITPYCLKFTTYADGQVKVNLTVSSYIKLEHNVSSFLGSGQFRRLLITFASSMDPDQGIQNIGPDLDPNCFDTLMIFLKIYFRKSGFFKKSTDD